MDVKNTFHFNIGLLGHVDSGKTTLARKLSNVGSTAAFDKDPQSQLRGITLDLGFSAFQLDYPTHLNSCDKNFKHTLYTLVDCPGHASLIKTVIGGAQIIDLVLLMIDCKKVIQTQTAECIVIAEMLNKKLIVVVNKIDVLDQSIRENYLKKVHTNLRKVFAKTIYGYNLPICNISAENGENVEALLKLISVETFVPERNVNAPFAMYADHCFVVKGKGNVCTGTIIQGKISVGDLVEVPLLNIERKVKSIQIFRNPVEEAKAGDRVGICFTQFDAKLLERGQIIQPGSIKYIYAACIRIQPIKYYKHLIKSKIKFHITSGHDTVMSDLILFENANNGQSNSFEIENEYMYVDQLDQTKSEPNPTFALLTFERPILVTIGSLLIASNLATNLKGNSCRLSFWGRVEWMTHSNFYIQNDLPKFNVYKLKQKQGYIQRVINNNMIVVQNLIKNENCDIYIGKKVQLSTGESGKIESSFGKTSKVKVFIPEGLNECTLDLLKLNGVNRINVILNYKKYLFKKDFSIVQ